MRRQPCSTAYAETIERHTEVLAAISRHAAPEELKAAQDKRTAAATRVLDAWTSFDAAIAALPELARDPSVLLVFRLNDALYSRAKWFVDQPTTDTVAPFLVAAAAPRPSKSPRSADAATRLHLVPPRIVWARRYQRLIEGPARQLFELQESNRFAIMETAAYAFEQAMLDMGPAVAATSVPGRRKAAQAAAALGLYVSDPKALAPRTPFARKLVPQNDKDVEQAMRGRGIRLL